MHATALLAVQIPIWTANIYFFLFEKKKRIESEVISLVHVFNAWLAHDNILSADENDWTKNALDTSEIETNDASAGATMMNFWKPICKNKII